jgi:hypothetical protein
MELYMAVAEGYRLTLDVKQCAFGDYGWYIYLALSQEPGKGALVASDTSCNSASEAAAAGMQALGQYKCKVGWPPVTMPTPTPTRSALAY